MEPKLKGTKRNFRLLRGIIRYCRGRVWSTHKSDLIESWCNGFQPFDSAVALLTSDYIPSYQVIDDFGEVTRTEFELNPNGHHEEHDLRYDNRANVTSNA